MKKLIVTFAALVGAFVLAAQNPASATYIPCHPSGPIVTSSGLSGASGYFLGGTFCTASTLIIAATIIGNSRHRELSQEEAATALVTCFFPPALLLACNSAWRVNNSLPPSVRRLGRHRLNALCRAIANAG